MASFFLSDGVYLALVLGGVALLVALGLWYFLNSKESGSAKIRRDLWQGLGTTGFTLALTSALYLSGASHWGDHGGLMTLLWVGLAASLWPAFKTTANFVALFCVSLTGTLFLASNLFPDNPEYEVYPFALSGLAVLGVTIAMLLQRLLEGIFSFFKVAQERLTASLVFLSYALALGGLFLLPSYFLFGPDDWFWLYLCVATGIALAMVIHGGLGFLGGVSLTLLTLTATGLAMMVAYHLEQGYGIALVGMGLLSISGIITAPVFFKTGGNSMKSYALASTSISGLVLFQAFLQELQSHRLQRDLHALPLNFSLSQPEVIFGLFCGACLSLWIEPMIQKLEGRRLIHGLAPSLLIALFLLVFAAISVWGATALGGFLIGLLVVGVVREPESIQAMMIRVSSLLALLVIPLFF